jgi:transcriptional regulator with XRE-family HTH domain
MSELLKIIGQRIRFIRKEKDMSQEKLAELADLHTNYVGAIERAEAEKLTVQSLVKVTSALGISIEQLFRYTDNKGEKDDLQIIMDILSEKSAKDRTLALALIRSVFEWEKDKYKY